MRTSWAESIPVSALVTIGVLALIAAALIHALDVAFQRMSVAAAEDLVEEERPHALLLTTLLEQRKRTILTVRGVRTFFQVIFAVSFTLAIAGVGLSWWASALIALATISLLQFVLVAVIPARFASRRPEGIAVKGARFASVLVDFSRLFDPLLARVRGRLPRCVPTQAEARAEMANDLREMVDEVGETEGFEDEDRQMLRSVLDLGHTLVREVMVPRTEMVTAPADLPARKALRLFVRSGFSRIPVEGDDVDDIRGVLYFKDVVQRLETYGPDLDQVAEQMMRPAVFTVEMKHADDLLRMMRDEHFHQAIVIDEYGGVAGLVTLEDLIEEVVGELTDEHDRVVLEAEDLGDGTWRVPARYPLSELGELFHMEIEDEDVDSVGGLLAKALGRVPLPGAVGVLGGIRMEAQEARGRRRQVGTILCSPAQEDNEASKTISED